SSHALRYRIEEGRSENAWFNQVKLLGVTNGPLDQFQVVLETMVKELSTSRKRDQFKAALLWKFTKKEVEDALARIERLKLLINCALTNDLMCVHFPQQRGGLLTTQDIVESDPL
ncbi:hypothetical protein LTR99_011281, partial [Exophiala xenobiotica]